MKKILILGKSGQLGAELVKEVEKQNIHFISLGREDVDVTDSKALDKLITKTMPSMVINTTAFHVVEKCEENPLKAFETNCVAVKNIAESCKKVGSKYVTFSTDYVFDGIKGSLYLEEDVPNPLQMYGLSKYAGEIVSQNSYPNGSYIIRTCGVYGGKRGSRSKNGNFVLKVLEAKGKDKIEVSSDQIVNPTSAKCLAKATLDLMQADPKPGVYHLASEGYLSWSDFAKILLRHSGTSTKVVPVDRSGEAGVVKRPLFSALGNTKAKKMGIVLPKVEVQVKEYLDELFSKK